MFRVQVWCLSTCLWNDTQQRKSINLSPASTGRVWATARITRVSSCTLMPGREVAAHQTYPVTPLFKWTPATQPCWSVQTMTRCHPPPAEGPDTRDAAVCHDRIFCAIVDVFKVYLQFFWTGRDQKMKTCLVVNFIQFCICCHVILAGGSRALLSGVCWLWLTLWFI